MKLQCHLEIYTHMIAVNYYVLRIHYCFEIYIREGRKEVESDMAWLCCIFNCAWDTYENIEILNYDSKPNKLWWGGNSLICVLSSANYLIKFSSIFLLPFSLKVLKNLSMTSPITIILMINDLTIDLWNSFAKLHPSICTWSSSF